MITPLHTQNLTPFSTIFACAERALAWAREREEAAVYNDAITREYDDEKFLGKTHMPHTCPTYQTMLSIESSYLLPLDISSDPSLRLCLYVNVASVLDFAGKKLVYTEEANDEATPGKTPHT